MIVWRSFVQDVMSETAVLGAGGVGVELGLLEQDC